MPISDESMLQAPAGLLGASAVPAAVRQALVTLVEGSPAPERVQRYLNEFELRHPGRLEVLAQDHAQRLPWLITVFAYSHFLAEELIQHPEWITEVSDLHRVLQVADYQERLSGLLAQ